MRYGIFAYLSYGLTIDHRDIVNVKSYNRYLLNIDSRYAVFNPTVFKINNNH
jgi:hypothetical protein